MSEGRRASLLRLAKDRIEFRERHCARNGHHSYVERMDIKKLNFLQRIAMHILCFLGVPAAKKAKKYKGLVLIKWVCIHCDRETDHGKKTQGFK